MPGRAGNCWLGARLQRASPGLDRARGISRRGCHKGESWPSERRGSCARVSEGRQRSSASPPRVARRARRARIMARQGREIAQARFEAGTRAQALATTDSGGWSSRGTTRSRRARGLAKQGRAALEATAVAARPGPRDPRGNVWISSSRGARPGGHRRALVREALAALGENSTLVGEGSGSPGPRSRSGCRAPRPGRGAHGRARPGSRLARRKFDPGRRAPR